MSYEQDQEDLHGFALRARKAEDAAERLRAVRDENRVLRHLLRSARSSVSLKLARLIDDALAKPEVKL